MKKAGKLFAGLATVALLAAAVVSGYELSTMLRGDPSVGARQTPDLVKVSVLSAPAAYEQDTVSDTLRPLVWFDGKVDCYDLFDWDYFEDVNATGLTFLVIEDSYSASQQIFQAYADQLCEESCLQEISRQPYENDFGEYDQEACFTYTGSKSVGSVTSSHTRTRCNLMVTLTLSEIGGGIIDLAWGDGFPMDTAPYDTSIERVYFTDFEDADDSGSSGAAETVSAVTSGDGILPDAHAFFNGELTHTEESITNGTKVVFSVTSEYAAAAYEYAELLMSGRFGLSLTQTLTDGFSGSDLTTVYIFDYTGGKDVDQVSLYTNSTDVYGAAIVRINDWPAQGWCEMSIRFSDGLAVADTGDRCSVTGLVDDTEHGISGPIGGEYTSSGSSGSGIDWDDDDGGGTSLRILCPKCHGDGEVECSQCNGDKGKWVYDSVPNYSGHSNTTARTWEACFKCGGTGKVRCPKCDGDRYIYT